jgi:hypothetical protein
MITGRRGSASPYRMLEVLTLGNTATSSFDLRFYQGFVLSMPGLRDLMLLLISDFIV